MKLILDAETTAQSPGQICQLAWLTLEDDAVSGFCRFYRVDAMSETSESIHGFSMEALETLSGGRRFADDAPMLHALLFGAELVIGHNISADLRFLRAEFERCGLALPETPSYCTMNHGTPVTNLKRRWNNRSPKPPKLTELCAHFSLSEETISRHCAEWFQTNAGPHDARFDAAAALLCYQKLISI